jgi:hypothetical protein
VLSADAAAAALRAARQVGNHLRERAQVETAVAAAALQSTSRVRWHAPTVAQGYAGLAILCSYLDDCFPGEGWDGAGHQHLAVAVRAAEQDASLPVGLFSGAAGVAFAAWCLSRQGTRYARLLRGLDNALLPRVTTMAIALSRSTGGSVEAFDVISGLSGVGAYLLCRQADRGGDTALHAALSALVALTREGGNPPCWHTPYTSILDETMRRSCPYGNINCGLAHGIPGPLSLLALAKTKGVDVDGLAGATDRVARWLADQRIDDAWGVNWPTVVPLGPPAASVGPTAALPTAPPPQPSRTAWCYGSPGVARALWLAGEALDHQGYRDLAIAAMEAVYRRPQAQRQIDSPIFCHGVAGLLHITLRFAHDTGLELFNEAARTLTAQLLSLYEPTTLLGYRHTEADGRRVDQPGLLDGAPGVSLVLLAAATGVEPTWDRLFLLA